MSPIVFDFYWQFPLLGSLINHSFVPIELAASMEEMETKKYELRFESPEALEKLHVLFDEMIQMCLWCVLLSPLQIETRDLEMKS